jgi:hypothetical protein
MIQSGHPLKADRAVVNNLGIIFQNVDLMSLCLWSYVTHRIGHRGESMRMRYLAFAFAAAIAVLALQHGTARKSVLLSGDTMNILEMHMAAHKNLPEMVIEQSH